ncbi:MAG: exodeoxyribonuclease VII small subunit [Prolixibacteraceae bacterium]|jgi:exodeoxyribonuclease VII small subunit|nr:exodeoxyribonuclease VII small subunit [Prolixibacteraceae bacterium]
MTVKKGLSYKEAIGEIEDILKQIENDEPDVDQLSEKVKRLSVLVTWCREKLHQTEEEIEKILKEIEKS